MFLLAYRSSKHEATGITPTELYFARELRLPIDLIQESPKFDEESLPPENFVENLRNRLEEIRSCVREQMILKSSQIKARYDREARTVLFEEGERVWFYNPRRSKGMAQKFQSNWEGPYSVVKKINDVIYCIQRTPKQKGRTFKQISSFS